MYTKNKFWDELLRQRYIILFVILFPIMAATIISVSMEIPLDLIQISNDWIGFWGSYLGAILGGIITLTVMKKTNIKNQEISEINIRNEFCNELSELIGKFCVYASECYYTNRHDESEDYYRQNRISLKSIRYILEIRLNGNDAAYDLLNFISALDENINKNSYCKGENDNNLNDDIQMIINKSKRFINDYKKEL